MQNKPTIGIIGAGRLGTSLARQSLRAGYNVRIANSKGPDSLDLILSVLLPGAVASTIEDVIADSMIIILALPLSKYRSLPASLFYGKIIIDATNYWAPTEGKIAEFAEMRTTSSEHIQSYFKSAIVIKTLNHVAYNELEEHSSPRGSSQRRAVALAGNDDKAKQIVSHYIEDLGFDAIDFGALQNGILFQPDTPLFNARLTKNAMRRFKPKEQ